jgi:CRP-like cAMP-binding protein
MRLVQMLKLVGKVKDATKGEMSLEFLIPHMHLINFNKGDVVFKKGELADKLYLLREGYVLLEELDVSLGPGEIIGEIGILSGGNERMATLTCESDAEFLYIDDEHMLQLYNQNPEFGLYLVQLIIKRLNGDVRLRSLSRPIVDNPQ